MLHFRMEHNYLELYMKGKLFIKILICEENISSIETAQ